MCGGVLVCKVFLLVCVSIGVCVLCEACVCV